MDTVGANSDAHVSLMGQKLWAIVTSRAFGYEKRTHDISEYLFSLRFTTEKVIAYNISRHLPFIFQKIDE